jgi:hypothetical protein
MRSREVDKAEERVLMALASLSGLASHDYIPSPSEFRRRLARLDGRFAELWSLWRTRNRKKGGV